MEAHGNFKQTHEKHEGEPKGNLGQTQGKLEGNPKANERKPGETYGSQMNPKALEGAARPTSPPSQLGLLPILPTRPTGQKALKMAHM